MSEIMSFQEFFRNQSRTMLAEAKKVGIIPHKAARGREREKLLEAFLGPLLPERFAIGHGEIRAANGVWSKEGDLIIYDRLSSPKLFVGEESQILPAESVVAVIEVKTTLDKKAIEEATKNIQSARRLEKEGMSTYIGPGLIGFGKPSPIFGALFAFQMGYKSLKAFANQWEQFQSPLPHGERINLVCVLGKRVIIHVDNTFHLWDETTKDLLGNFVFLKLGKDSLLAFFLLLMRVLFEFRAGAPNLFKYFFHGGKKIEAPFG